MKYTVIVGGNPYVVVADWMTQADGRVLFGDNICDDNGVVAEDVAEFKQDKIDGIIFEDNNLED